jgi:hypothetical protein
VFIGESFDSWTCEYLLVAMWNHKFIATHKKKKKKKKKNYKFMASILLKLVAVFYRKF